MSQKKIIGIAGAFGSGKSTAADILQDLGYQKISLGRLLEDELERRGETIITRKKLQDLGNEWRKKYGSAILIKKAFDLIERNNWNKVVIEGYRNSEEVLELRAKKEVLLISLVVNRETRFNRLKRLNRREKLTREIFNALDNRDLGIGEENYGLQTGICIAMADIFIENNGSLGGLATRLKKVVKDYE